MCRHRVVADSVVVMLGCVGSVLQVSVCVWTLLTCLRKPRRSREIVTVVGAISGGELVFITLP